MLNPSPKHIGAIDRAIAYLYHTRNYALEYSAEATPVFTGASDASYADDVVTRKSTEGFLFQLFGGSIDWRSNKQKTVTTSSTEAELLAITHAGKEIMWWKRFLMSIAFNPDHEVTLECDNQQTIRLLRSDSPRLATKLKHVEISNLWLKQEVQAGKLHIEWVGTADMKADGLTKALLGQKH